MTSPYRRIEADPHHVETERRYVERPRSPGPVALVVTVLAVVAIVWIAMSGDDTTDGDGGVPSIPTTLVPGGDSPTP
ncbi:MAG: hypothetical protein R3324_20970 [Halobacteriales archaeon]|nr:hypothetical protein [Halobacteriales archaeon]